MDATNFAKAVTIALLDGCNLTCAHCYRPKLTDPRAGTFRLTFRQVEVALDEINELQRGAQGLPELKVYFTGGEPCIWRDDGKDLVDVLHLVANRYGSKPRFDTNGVLFGNKDWCSWFLDRYFRGTDIPVKIIFSCDQFHRGSAKACPGYQSYKASSALPAVDNVIDYGQRTNRTGKLDLEVMWVSSTDAKHEFPSQLETKYPSVQFAVVALLPSGSAAGMSPIAPSLTVLNADGTPNSSRDSLGVFLPHLSRLLAKQHRQLDGMTNEQVFDAVSRCGELPNPFFCWDGKYYYCIPRLGEPEFLVAEIGDLMQGAAKFEHKDIEGMKKGIIAHLRDTVHPTRMDTCMKTQHYLRYAGCSFCRSLVGARRV